MERLRQIKGKWFHHDNSLVFTASILTVFSAESEEWMTFKILEVSAAHEIK